MQRLTRAQRPFGVSYKPHLWKQRNILFDWRDPGRELRLRNRHRFEELGVPLLTEHHGDLLVERGQFDEIIDLLTYPKGDRADRDLLIGHSDMLCACRTECHIGDLCMVVHPIFAEPDFQTDHPRRRTRPGLVPGRQDQSALCVRKLQWAGKNSLSSGRIRSIVRVRSSMRSVRYPVDLRSHTRRPRPVRTYDTAGTNLLDQTVRQKKRTTEGTMVT